MDGGAGCEPHRVMRGAFELMRVLAINKRAGSRGERGPAGKAGGDGWGEGGVVRELMEKQVCGEYAEFASGVEGEFWEVVARAEHGSDPFVGFCETRGAWRSEKLESHGARELVGLLGPVLTVLVPIVGDAPKVVAMQTREVYGSKDGMAVSVGRTVVVGEGGEWYVVTSVETARGGDTVRVFVANVDRLVHGVVVPVYRRSVEHQLLDLAAVGVAEEACEMVTALGRMGSGREIRVALRERGYGVPTKAVSEKISEVVRKTLDGVSGPNVEGRVMGVVGGGEEVYALVVPVEKGTGKVYEGRYIVSGTGLRVTEAGEVHEGAVVVVVERQPRPKSVVCVYFVTVDYGMGGVPLGVVFETRDGKYTGTVWFLEQEWLSVLTTRTARNLPYRASSDEELRDVVGMGKTVNSQCPMELTRHEITGAITRIGSYKGPTGGGMYTMLSIWESGKETAKCVMPGYGYDEASVREKLTYLDVGEGDVFQDLVCGEGVQGGITGLKVVGREESEGEMEVVRVESARGVSLVEPRDGGEVTINGREWKRRNLRVTEYKDGTPIRRASTEGEFIELSKSKTPAYFCVDERSGYLYNRYVSESGVSPEGWGLPTIADVFELWKHHDIDAELIPQHAGGDVIIGSSDEAKAAEALMDPQGDFKAEMTGFVTEQSEVVGRGDIASMWNRGEGGWWFGDGGSGCVDIQSGGISNKNEWYEGHQYEGNGIRLVKRRRE
jgi:hypothetical protein